MTWVNNGDFPLNRVYLSKAITEEEIAKDLAIVVKQCIKNKNEDKAENGKTILFYTNATNGYIGIYFYNMDEMDQIGNSSYLLELPELWKKSNNHEDGAFYYDEITKRSSILFGQMNDGKKLKIDIKFYFTDELENMVIV